MLLLYTTGDVCQVEVFVISVLYSNAENVNTHTNAALHFA